MKSCISAGEQDNIPISIGEGKWYTLKIEKIKQNVQTQNNTGIPLFPYSGWGNFPSHGPQMHKHFNKGHIHHHIVESVQFLNEDTFDDEVDSDDDSGLQIRVRTGKLVSLFLIQNICCGYTKEPSQ